ncbi:hypothetical protein [Streptomyces longisporus]|uniref:Uncharacterized protein n=1 Tax=Streptomyces longisporus TaxID=1948 RepID=A0ABN3LTY5_STRLO
MTCTASVPPKRDAQAVRRLDDGANALAELSGYLARVVEHPADGAAVSAAAESLGADSDIHPDVTVTVADRRMCRSPRQRAPGVRGAAPPSQR